MNPHEHDPDAPPSLDDCITLDCGCDGECERSGRGLRSSYDVEQEEGTTEV